MRQALRTHNARETGSFCPDRNATAFVIALNLTNQHSVSINCEGQLQAVHADHATASPIAKLNQAKGNIMKYRDEESASPFNRGI